MSSLTQATRLFDSFKQAYGKGSAAEAEEILLKLKLKLTELPGLPPMFEKTPTQAQELTLARDILEHAVLLSVHMKDDTAFERNFNQLSTYYTDAKSLVTPSVQENTIVGLNLLRLLVQNRIAEFHTEIEALSVESKQNANIQPVIQLEQWLMEGAFNKVLGAQQNLPTSEHRKLVEQLSGTVRDEIAGCSERAYEKLSVSDAQKLLMFTSASSLQKYADDRGWQLANSYYVFVQPDHAARKELPSHDIINNVLVYAKELERIV